MSDSGSVSYIVKFKKPCGEESKKMVEVTSRIPNSSKARIQFFKLYKGVKKKDKPKIVSITAL